jgi:hypothetical protein
VNDLATFRDPSKVVALTTLTEPSGAYELTVYESDDSGATFRALGPPISDDVFGLTVDVAPSNDQRLYVSGFLYRAGTPLPAGSDGGPLDAAIEASTVDAGQSLAAPGVLLRSTDGGATFSRVAIPEVGAGEEPFIAAVDPKNADILYVRVAGAPAPEGVVESRLLYSEDGGDHFRQVFEGAADMLGFALGDDGATVYVGLGDSHDLSGQRPVDTNALGIYRGAAPDFSFTRELVGQVGCLLSASTGLFVCGDHGTTKFELGLSTDEGKTATSIFDWGPKFGTELACPSKSGTARACDPQWPMECDTYGISCPGAETPTTTVAARGGCGCGSPGRKSAPPPETGTVSLSFESEPFELTIAALALAGAVLRRLGRR